MEHVFTSPRSANLVEMSMNRLEKDLIEIDQIWMSQCLQTELGTIERFSY